MHSVELLELALFTIYCYKNLRGLGKDTAELCIQSSVL